VLPLGNFWDDYGGARQYVAWAGLDDPHTGDARFFTDAAVVAHYASHVAAVLDRVSAVDGIRYGNHPAVLAWELLNEPRADAVGVAPMRAWVDAIGAVVKAHAPGQLLGTGEEGLDLEQFRLDAASPFVDLASVHLFPESWGAAGDAVAAFGARHLDTRIAEARALGKPVLVGEFGLRNDGLPLDDRRAVYRGWFRCARRAGAGGEAPWMFAYDARPDGWDAFTFYDRDGTVPADPVNRYADLVEEAAR
jgi:mannan endo-1,4-beta-mannosidase